MVNGSEMWGMLKDPKNQKISTRRLWNHRNVRKRASRNIFWSFNKWVAPVCEVLSYVSAGHVVNRT